jgi:hemerythrin-like domain-containing protein
VDIFTRLTNDHRLIARALDAFERFLTEAGESDSLSRMELYRFSTFFREFVELSHHALEEEVLLPAMVELGYAWNGAPLAHVRDEHDRERRLLFELRRRALEPAFTPKERAEVIRLGCDLIAFQRNHMRKEGALLYPVVQRELADKRLTELDPSETKKKTSAAAREEELLWLRTLAEELVSDHPAASPAEAAVTTRDSVH